MRGAVLAVAIVVTSALSAEAFLHASPTAISDGFARALSPLRGRAAPRDAALRLSPRTTRGPPRMTIQAEEGGSKKAELKRLAEEAAKAVEEARLAEEKASAMRRSRGEASRTLSRESDMRAKLLLGSVGEVLYKTWASVLAGRPLDEAHDFLGLAHGSEMSLVSDGERRERVRVLFDRLDTDGSGAIDAAELAVGVREVLAFDADESQLMELMREVDGNNDGSIDLAEFTAVCLNIMNKAEAEAAAAADAAAKEAAIIARTRTFQSVMQALEQAGGLAVESFPKVALAGNASAAVAVMTALKRDGKIALWDSQPRLFQSTGAERMKAVTGMVNPEEDLGLAVDGFTRFRYQGVSALGLTGILALLLSGLPGPWVGIGLTPDRLESYGYLSLIINGMFSAFAPQLERLNMQRLLAAQGDAEDRWARKQAGRFVAAYVCGLPIESVEAVDVGSGLTETLIFSRQTGNIDVEQLRQALQQQQQTGEGFLQLGLSKSEIDRQSIVQMCGLVAEYRKYGKASVGFRFFRELDDQLDLSQEYMSRQAKQVQARFGITVAYQILDRHAYAFEQVVAAFKAGKTPAEAVAIFESAVAPEGWVDDKFTPPSLEAAGPEDSVE